MKYEEVLKELDKGKKISVDSYDVTSYLVKGGDGQIHEYNFEGNLETFSPLLSEVKKESNKWYVVSEDKWYVVSEAFIKRFRKASDYLKHHGWYHNSDTVLLKEYKLGFIENYINAVIDLKDLSCSLSLIDINGYNLFYDIFPVDKIEDEDSIYDVKLAFNETKKDFEFVKNLLYTDYKLGIVKYDEEWAKEAVELKELKGK